MPHATWRVRGCGRVEETMAGDRAQNRALPPTVRRGSKML